ncbi:ubiquinol oxidase subunit II [Halomonas garicola]|uniref:ubiquinol oxidase subunit II n=1 Tax=Halomonas garicola TaxID=1690008 RepID=UPI00289CD508|nr:ubiquinol oxidase subunit II [Halomonas garicola]
MRRKSFTRAIGTLLLITLPLLLAGCGSALLDSRGQIGHEQTWLILTAFGLMLLVVIPVIGMTLWFAVRYRRSSKTAVYEPDWAHSNAIEVVVWLIPCVIIAILATLTWKTTHSLDPHKPLESDAEPMEIQVVSLDWKWLFIYPEEGIATVNEVAFPEDVPVRFRVTSGSVMNSFFIPRLGSQIYAMAGMDNDVHLIADEQGTYPGRSTNYSGSGFAGMTFDAIATSQEGFDDWVAKARESDKTLTFPEQYDHLALPTRDVPVKYFSEISPGLYEDILQSFHTGREADGPSSSDGKALLNAEAAE